MIKSIRSCIHSSIHSSIPGLVKYSRASLYKSANVCFTVLSTQFTVIRTHQSIHDRTCVSHCPLGFYDNLEARRCRRCHKGCERCVGRTPTECRSCRRGLYFNPLNTTCSETCPAGYFADDSKSSGVA